MASKKRCGQCGESVYWDARICRFCNHTFSDESLAAEKSSQNLRYFGRIAIVVAGFAAVISCVGGTPSSTPSSTIEPVYSAPAKTAELSGFTWQSHGDTYCYANGKLTNTGTVGIPYAQITLQFYRGQAIAGSDTTYAKVTDLSPGQSSTYSAMYECPGRNTTIEVTATSRGDAIALSNPTAGKP